MKLVTLLTGLSYFYHDSVQVFDEEGNSHIFPYTEFLPNPELAEKLNPLGIFKELREHKGDAFVCDCERCSKWFGKNPPYILVFPPLV